MYVTMLYMQDKSPNNNTPAGPMFSKEDHEFIDFLFGKLTCLTDTDMIDLHEDDSCCDHLELERRAADLEMTVDEMLHADL